MKTVFISDLHLDKNQPELIKHFIEFIEGYNEEIDNLYILGDLVESWVGDDDPAIGTDQALEVIKTLSEKSGVYFMHGNRDFMISSKICNKYGMKLINDPTTITIFNKKITLMHGDLLCTDDIKYQEFRKLVRNEEWQKMMMTKSLKERMQYAESLRLKSKTETDGKQEFIMDVNNNEVENIFREHDADVLIHGHTHRPMVHDINLNKKMCKRIVLGDWGKQSHILEIDATGMNFKKILFT